MGGKEYRKKIHAETLAGGSGVGRSRRWRGRGGGDPAGEKIKFLPTHLLPVYGRTRRGGEGDIGGRGGFH